MALKSGAPTRSKRSNENAEKVSDFPKELIPRAVMENRVNHSYACCALDKHEAVKLDPK